MEFTETLRNLFRVNLGVKRSERVLVFTDKPTSKDKVSEEDLQRWRRLQDLVNLVVDTGRAFAKDVLYLVYSSRGSHGKEPPEALWRLAFNDKAIDALKDAGLFKKILSKRASDEELVKAEKIIKRRCRRAVDAVVALSNYSTSHTRFRDFLTRIYGTRYASMPLFDVSMFEGPMAVDWKDLERLTKKVANLVSRAHKVRLTTPNGTELTVEKRGRKAMADTGNLRRAGSFGNLPAGEVFFAPVEGTASGKLVLQWGPTRRLSSELLLNVQDGMVTSIEGQEPLRQYLEEKFAERQENRNIAEFGIGTNPKARRPDNILESEKILGTVHVALGDNSSFGGTINTPFHQDFVFFHPTVTLRFRDGKELTLIEDGRLVIE